MPKPWSSSKKQSNSIPVLHQPMRWPHGATPFLFRLGRPAARRRAKRNDWRGLRHDWYRIDATALCVAGFVIADIARDFDTGMAIVSRALALNPNLVTAWYLGGWVRVINGEPELAIEHFSHAERLSPFDPLTGAVHLGVAYAHFFAGRDDQALSAVEHCLVDMPNYRPALLIVAASNAFLGATDRARTAIARIRELNPGTCLSEFKKRTPCRRSEHIARVIEGLRKAGSRSDPRRGTAKPPAARAKVY